VDVHPLQGHSFGVPSHSRIHRQDLRLLAFGRAIRETRKEQGLSQEGLALKTGLDRSYMGGVERGDNNVTLLKAYAIAKALGLSLSELIHVARL
jgi:transcriptional regulator with XRE-family HTH domain